MRGARERPTSSATSFGAASSQPSSAGALAVVGLIAMHADAK